MREREFMEGADDPFDFQLAENLRMTVDQMRSIMTNDEWLRWKAFYVYRKAQMELAENDAK